MPLVSRLMRPGGFSEVKVCQSRSISLFSLINTSTLLMAAVYIYTTILLLYCALWAFQNAHEALFE